MVCGLWSVVGDWWLGVGCRVLVFLLNLSGLILFGFR